MPADGLLELDRSRAYVFLRADSRRTWKPVLEMAVREACDAVGIQRRGVHGLRGTAASEFLRIKRDVLGLSESESRRELAQWLGHSPHRTEVTYAYVPRERRRGATSSCRGIQRAPPRPSQE